MEMSMSTEPSSLDDISQRGYLSKLHRPCLDPSSCIFFYPCYSGDWGCGSMAEDSRVTLIL